MQSQRRDRIVGLLAVLLLSPVAFAQNAQRANPGAGNAAAPAKASAPAPKRDITGVWFHNGPGNRINKTSPMTPWGQAIFATHKTSGADLVADSTDPLVKCDPLGFPRNITWEMRGVQFVTTPIKTVELFQYQRIWREIWTDGRALPKNAGSDAINAPDPRYYGYSIGHWDDDYNFVVETVGTDSDTWLDNAGDPHSEQLHVTENYKRVDHDNLEITLKIDDPKAYTQPFTLATVNYTWNPQQEFEEQLCIPSDAQRYLDLIANPAGGKK
jgi:hypothetical protein